MSDVIQLDQYKRKQQAKRSFKYWNAQFRQSFDETTTITDLPDNVLLFLASPGEKSAGVVYQLIEQVKYPGRKPIPKEEAQQVEMDLMDIHLFLSDKFRFEMMLRLGWIEGYSGVKKPVLDLIADFSPSDIGTFDNPPRLTADHPRLNEYEGLIPREQELFIRKLFVNALIEFNQKVNG